MGTIGVKRNAVSMRKESMHYQFFFLLRKSMHYHDHYMGGFLYLGLYQRLCLVCLCTACLFFIFGVLF